MPSWNDIYDLRELLSQRDSYIAPQGQPNTLVDIDTMSDGNLTSALALLPSGVRTDIMDVVNDHINNQLPATVETDTPILTNLIEYAQEPFSIPVYGSIKQEKEHREKRHDCPLCGRNHQILNP